MKVAILGDTHFGARNDSLAFHGFFEKFYELFFAELKKSKIDTIIQVGDLWDRRKYVNFQTLSESRKYFFDKLKEQNLKMITILGNHDITFKNTLEVNASDLLLQEYDNITVISSPTTITLDKTEFLMLPWICTDNYKESMDAMENTKAKILFGHLEIAGFEMHKGQPSEHGFDRAIFKKFDTVYSGHFHHRSSDGNISYLGTPYEITWSDYQDQKGFHIFDTAKNSMKFIQNPNIIFEKYYYDEDKDDPTKVDVSRFENINLKVIVVNKKDFAKFDNFMDRVYKKNPLEVKIIEDMSEFDVETDDDDTDVEDTITLLSNYVDNVDTDINKPRLKNLLKTLYVEAQEYN